MGDKKTKRKTIFGLIFVAGYIIIPFLDNPGWTSHFDYYGPEGNIIFAILIWELLVRPFLFKSND